MNIVVNTPVTLETLTEEFKNIHKDWDLLENLSNSTLWQSDRALGLTADIQDAVEHVEAFMLDSGLLSEAFYSKSIQFKRKMTPLSDKYLVEYLTDNKELPYSGFDIFLHWSFVMKTFSAPLLLLSFIDHEEDFKETGINYSAFEEVKEAFTDMAKVMSSEGIPDLKIASMLEFSKAYDSLLSLFLKIADNLYAMRGLMYVDAEEDVSRLNLDGVVRVLKATYGAKFEEE